MLLTSRHPGNIDHDAHFGADDDTNWPAIINVLLHIHTSVILCMYSYTITAITREDHHHRVVLDNEQPHYFTSSFVNTKN